MSTNNQTNSEPLPSTNQSQQEAAPTETTEEIQEIDVAQADQSDR